MRAKDLQAELDAVGSPKDAEFLQRFFKTYDGGYAEGDIFIGLRVPITRKIAGKYKDLPLTEIEKLLESPIHEHRLAALVIMVNRAKKANDEDLGALYDLYLKRTDRINNWDLVDVSSKDVVGRYLFDKSRQPLYNLAASNDLWERRISMIATAYFIGKGQTTETWKLAKVLLSDKHDLIHKAVGWMLREAGKKDEAGLRAFLDEHAHEMPRTMLRYSLEKLHPSDRAYYMVKDKP